MFNQKHELSGLYMLREKKFLMCSATFNNFESEIVKTGCGNDYKRWLPFDTAPEFETGSKIEP